MGEEKTSFETYLSGLSNLDLIGAFEAEVGEYAELQDYSVYSEKVKEKIQKCEQELLSRLNTTNPPKFNRDCLSCVHEPDWHNNKGKCKSALLLYGEKESAPFTKYPDKVMTVYDNQVINCTGWSEKEE